MRGRVAVAALTMVVAAASGCSSASAGEPASHWSTAPGGVADNAETEINAEGAAPTADATPAAPGRPDHHVRPDRVKATPSPAPPAPTRAAPRATSSPAPAGTPVVFATYGVSFTVAGGQTGVVGPASGALKRYMVVVEKGLSESPSGVARTVDATLDNQSRGWLHRGAWRFQRVSTGPVDFIVELASPNTVDLICGKYGLDTGGVVSCRGGKNVVLNSHRWEVGTNGTTEGAVKYAPADYRVLVINHEVGHFLGYGHKTCPAPGAPAPVMMPSYYGADGCAPNIWPYAADGTLIG